VKRSKPVRRVVVSADGHGVVSHAGVGLLRKMAGYTGLVEGVTDALTGTCKGAPTHAPGRVFTDLAVAVADGADAISGIGVLTDREELFGPVASIFLSLRVTGDPYVRRVEFGDAGLITYLINDGPNVTRSRDAPISWVRRITRTVRRRLTNPCVMLKA
jgi:hypothetical protein